jgi:hypothetical protein
MINKVLLAAASLALYVTNPGPAAPPLPSEAISSGKPIVAS